MKTSIILLAIVSLVFVSSAPLDSGDEVDSGSVSANQDEVLSVAESVQEPVVAEEAAAAANDVPVEAPAGKRNLQEVIKDVQQIINQLNQTNTFDKWTTRDKNLFIDDGDIPLGVLEEKGRVRTPAEEPVPAAPDAPAEEPAPDSLETN